MLIATTRGLLIAVLVPAMLASTVTGQTASLHQGDVIPPLTGQTLSGKPLALPADAAGKPAIVAFSFSRSGGKDNSLWSDRLAKDFPGMGHPYTVMMIEAAPKFVRGMIISGTKKNMPPAAQDRFIAMERDEDLWKQRLNFTDEDHAYLFLIGPDGKIRWKNSGPFTDSEYAALKKELMPLLP
ncbi:MAG TPA: hypothetical protein VHT28_15555 [Silvibacterium sp.]|jgi:hypothetical protein|nr:hypothetical protein [Silvibacterium sp.]